MTTPAALAEIIRAAIQRGEEDLCWSVEGDTIGADAIAALDALVAQAERAAALEAERDTFQNAQRHADARVVDLFARAEAAESALDAATETLREIVGAHTELDGATVSFGVQNRHVDRFVAAMGEARAFLARTAGGKDEYPIRPIEKRGGYQPTAQGPPPTKPPPKPAGGKKQT